MAQVKGFTLSWDAYQTFRNDEKKTCLEVIYNIDGTGTLVPQGVAYNLESDSTELEGIIIPDDVAQNVIDGFSVTVFHFPTRRSGFRDFVKDLVKTYNQANTTRYSVRDLDAIHFTPVDRVVNGVTYLMLLADPTFLQTANQKEDDPEYLDLQFAKILLEPAYQPSPPAKPDDY